MHKHSKIEGLRSIYYEQKLTVNQSGTGMYDKTVNALTGSNLRDGEIHMPLYTKSGIKAGSFIGPGTSVIERIRNKTEPITEVDTIAKYHDIRYTLSTNPQEVRKADEKMMGAIKRSRKEKRDYKINMVGAAIPIMAKMKMEDIGIMKKGAFSDMDGNELSPEDRKMLEDELAEGEKMGYGKKKKKKNTWLTHVAECRKANPDMQYKACLKLASKSYKSS